jgi:phosphatidate cytidylyltransferase
LARAPAKTAPAGSSPGGARWSDLRLRALSAAVLVPVALGCLWLGGWAWAALVALGAVGLGWEWWQLCRRRPGPTPALTLFYGLPYLAPALVALLWLRAAPSVGLGNVLFVLLLVWASDIGAYVAGRAIGGPKLAPAISPGKTWSGAAGGTLAAIGVGLVAHVLWPGGPVAQSIGVAGALSVLSQIGDLFESGLKRHFGVKDSSRLIPGHGGLLDRLDGVLAAAPAAAALALVLGRGVALW